MSGIQQAQPARPPLPPRTLVLLVSVIIPARNAATLLPGQLEALSRQEYTGPWEVVVVDNGSNDRTAAVAREWTDKLPHLRVVYAERKGVNHARNVGAAAARGALLIFCDADDVATPGWLSAMTQAARDADLVGGYAKPYAVRNQHACRWRPPPPSDRLPESMGYLPYARGASLGVRTEVFDALGGFNEAYAGGGDDVEFCWRAQLATYTLAFAADAVMRYRQRECLWPLIRQAYGAGLGHAQLMRDFRAHGLPPVSARAAAHGWYQLLRRLPELTSGDRAAIWCYEASRRAGRLVGSVRYGVSCL